MRPRPSRRRTDPNPKLRYDLLQHENIEGQRLNFRGNYPVGELGALVAYGRELLIVAERAYSLDIAGDLVMRAF